jgi:hypothetical protein
MRTTTIRGSSRWGSAVLRGLAVLSLAPAGILLSGLAPATAHAAPMVVSGAGGYRLLAGDGGVFSFGGAPFFGSAASDPNNCPAILGDRNESTGTCFSMAATPDGGGYWILNGDRGRIFTYGDATNYGQPADIWDTLPRAEVPTALQIVSTPSGHGYWVVTSTGAVLNYGEAQNYGSEAGAPLNGRIVGMAATSDGLGYWLVAADGGVFAFGDATFAGSEGGQPLNQPVVGMAASPTGGYWLVAADGGVFTFGSATFAGSMAGQPLNQPVVGMAASPNGGYWLVAADGGVFTFGVATFAGSMAGQPLNQPVFAITPTASGPSAT